MELCIPCYMIGKRVQRRLGLEDLLHLISLMLLLLVLLQVIIQEDSGSFTCPSILPVACRLILNMYAMDWSRAGCGYHSCLRLKGIWF